MLPNILALVYWRRRPQRKKILRSCAISIFEPPLVRNSLACFKSKDASSWSHLLFSTEELLLVGLTYQVWECVKDIHFAVPKKHR